MTRRLLIFGFLILVFVGCAPVSITPTGTGISYPIDTPIVVPTATSTSIPTTLSSTPRSLNLFFPKNEKRCPENREVSFDKINIDSVTILSDLGHTGLWKYSAEDQAPILLKQLPLDSWRNLTIDPTGEKLAYIARNQDGSSSIWLLLLISGDQNEISRINYMEGAAPYIKWLTPNELLVGGSCAGAGCPFPIKVLKIANGTEVNVEEVEWTPNDNYLGFFASKGKYLALYSSSGNDIYNQFQVYDYLDGRKVSIFPWLDEKVLLYPLIGTNFGLFGSDNNLAMFIEQSYGFDVGIVTVNIEEMTQNLPYDSLMKRVFAEIQFNNMDYSFIVLNPSNTNLMISMSYTDDFNSSVDNNFSKPPYVEDSLFVVDLENPIIDEGLNELVFIDYCFTTTGYYSKGFSPDGHVSVFSSDDEIVFLNLGTGNISRLSGWLFVGWGK